MATTDIGHQQDLPNIDVSSALVNVGSPLILTEGSGLIQPGIITIDVDPTFKKALEIYHAVLESKRPFVGLVNDNGQIFVVPHGLDLQCVEWFEESITGKEPGSPERLVYADWCEEHGWNERAEQLRVKK